MNNASLLELYDDMNTEAFELACYEIQLQQREVPLGDIIDILDDTLDIDVTKILVETLMIRLVDIEDDLMHVVYPKGSEVIKRHIITVLSFSPTSNQMQFLLDEYFYNPYMRPAIRSQAFKDKKFLFINLTRYIDTHAIDKDIVDTTQQILKTIPKQDVISCSGLLAGTKIMDIYYAMPLCDRD